MLRELEAQCREHVSQVHDLDGYQQFDANVACPLLESSRCSIYPVRPLACRMYLVVSPPAKCSESSRAETLQVEAPNLRRWFRQEVARLRGCNLVELELEASHQQLSEALLDALGRVLADA